MGVQQGHPTSVDAWFQPGRYSLWAFDRGTHEPVLVAAYEWEVAGLQAVRPESVFFGEDDDLAETWEDSPLMSEIGSGAEASIFACLIAKGVVHRIGALPAKGRFAEPPSWLQDTTELPSPSQTG